MTDYVETAIMLAALEQDERKLNTLLSGMTHSELHGLEVACVDILANIRPWKDAGGVHLD